jgi:hypothetical protein
MRRILINFFLLIFLVPTAYSQQSEKQELISMMNDFFQSLERQDTTALRKLFMKESSSYFVRDSEKAPVQTGARSISEITFKPDRIIIERMRENEITIHIDRRIAVAWVPYDLWINQEFSHCGIDVFTFIKTETKWKIASIAYSMVPEGCNTKK